MLGEFVERGYVLVDPDGTIHSGCDARPPDRGRHRRPRAQRHEPVGDSRPRRLPHASGRSRKLSAPSARSYEELLAAGGGVRRGRPAREGLLPCALVGHRDAMLRHAADVRGEERLRPRSRYGARAARRGSSPRTSSSRAGASRPGAGRRSRAGQQPLPRGSPASSRGCRRRPPGAPRRSRRRRGERTPGRGRPRTPDACGSRRGRESPTGPCRSSSWTSVPSTVGRSRIAPTAAIVPSGSTST